MVEFDITENVGLHVSIYDVRLWILLKLDISNSTTLSSFKKELVTLGLREKLVTELRFIK